MSESTQEFVPYSREQLLEKSNELAGVLEKIDEVREEKAAAMKDFKKTEGDLSAKARKLSKVIRQKGEYRDRQATIFEVSAARKPREDA
ncbi:MULTISPECIES: hypothetical protein [Myxococcus]|uniref:hypothetical protein n=1 Tax=Myxococcus TaxID=32 RepID=UPI00112A6D90|nr:MULTISPECIES: hypothetical protein [Myxococcus]QDE83269.1 hypothetical protein BHS07_17855 [Myxococcus xanthus]WAM23863.1 hypothetical protein OZ403_25310 [Myxococcus sp. NMCA1]WNZ59941.1 hypothetical protein QEG98_28465 [Myxococcus sp. MxC21-1]